MCVKVRKIMPRMNLKCKNQLNNGFHSCNLGKSAIFCFALLAATAAFFFFFLSTHLLVCTWLVIIHSLLMSTLLSAIFLPCMIGVLVLCPFHWLTCQCVVNECC